jgi:hypothetical protein
VPISIDSCLGPFWLHGPLRRDDTSMPAVL